MVRLQSKQQYNITALKEEELNSVQGGSVILAVAAVIGAMAVNGGLLAGVICSMKN